MMVLVGRGGDCAAIYIWSLPARMVRVMEVLVAVANCRLPPTSLFLWITLLRYLYYFCSSFPGNLVGFIFCHTSNSYIVLSPLYFSGTKQNCNVTAAATEDVEDDTVRHTVSHYRGLFLLSLNVTCYSSSTGSHIGQCTDSWILYIDYFQYCLSYATHVSGCR